MAGALAAAIGAIFTFTRGTSDAWVESFAVRLCVSLTALALLVVVGWTVRDDLLYRRHDQDGWDRNVDRTVHLVSTVGHRCRLRTTPHAATAEGYVWTATDEFTLTLADGTEHRADIPSGGPPDLVVRAGPPSPLSTMIAERVSDVQLAVAQARIDAGDSVPFGPLTAGRDGLGTTGGLPTWSDIERVQVDHWAMNVVYDPRAEEVFRYLRLLIQVRTEAADDGREPRPSRWNVGEAPDVARLRRVRTPEGERLESAELEATDSQIPNFFTLLRLFDAYGKR